MIDLNKKTYRNILQALLDRVPNSLDKREGSMIQTALGAGAYALEEFYLELDQVQQGAYLQTAAQLAPSVRQAVEGYLLSVRQEWDRPDAGGLTRYSSWVYSARVTAAMLSVQGVVNVTGLTINGSAEDLELAENGLLQQVPVLGEVSVSA